MKKLFFIFAFCYSFSVFATSYVEPIYHLDENKSPCLYQSKYGESCKTCDASESFRILPVAIIDENGNHIPLDEKVCPQRKIVCNESGSYCNSVLKECPENFPIRSGFNCFSCNHNMHGYLGGTVQVSSEEECTVCSNRKAIKKNDKIYCVIKPEFAKKPLYLKDGYAGCDDCVNEEEVMECSKCLKYYDIIDGRCKKKKGWKCHQPYYQYT